MLEEVKSYFYILEHLPTSRYYAGCQYAKGCNPENLLKEDGYLTSSKFIKKLIKKDGINSFIIRKLKLFENETDAYEYETRFLEKVDAANNTRFLNGHNNDRRFPFGSEKWKEQFGEEVWNKGKKTGFWWSNGETFCISKTPPDETWFRSSPLKGMTFKKREKNSPASHIGTKWWTKDNKNKRSKECPGEGWVEGFFAIIKYGTGRNTWTKDGKNKVSKECPGEGWVKGITRKESINPTKDTKWWTSKEGENKRSKECPGEGWTEGFNRKIKNSRWTNGVEEVLSETCPGEGWYKKKRSKNKQIGA